jgi:hypothetical protein
LGRVKVNLQQQLAKIAYSRLQHLPSQRFVMHLVKALSSSSAKATSASA